MQVIKRDGRTVEFDESKIISACHKASLDAQEDIDSAQLKLIVSKTKEKINGSVPNIEKISDIVEENLMMLGLFKVAKAYILYRSEHKKKREKGWGLEGLQKDIYSQKYKFQNESFDGFLERVSGGNQKLKKIIRDKKFLFGGRILANRKLNELDNRKITLSNCYVITPPDDNIESIFETAKKLARTYSYGGGWQYSSPQ